MNFPPFHNPELVGRLFHPDFAAIAEHATKAELSAAEDDQVKTLLLIVDMQVDFCHPEGSLYVPGAEKDIRRLLNFLYREAGNITNIMCTMDSHVPLQIFHPAWWRDSRGNLPQPMTIITREEVESGKWLPLYKTEWSRRYVHLLEENARKQLLIWPYHVLEGGTGNLMDPALWSAVSWHGLARGIQPIWQRKGTLAETEHYSAVRPEVDTGESEQSRQTENFLRKINEYDRILIAGEAASHCVQETADDLVEEFKRRNLPLERLNLLVDCTSPVQHPEIDFAAMAQKKYEEFQTAGVRLVNSDKGMPPAVSQPDFRKNSG